MFVLAKKFPDVPLDSIAFNGFTDLLAYRNPQPGLGQLVWFEEKNEMSRFKPLVRVSRDS